MNIAVVGLGLIGGSVCKALKANTFHHIMGMDTDKETVRKALEQGAIDEEIDESRLGEANLTRSCALSGSDSGVREEKRRPFQERFDSNRCRWRKGVRSQRLHPDTGREGRVLPRNPPDGGY